MRQLRAKLTAIFILFCFSQTVIEAQKFKTYSIKYNTFNQSHYDPLYVQDPSTISNNALQVTPDSASPDFNKTHQSGRILLKQPFRLWDNKSIGSFNASFLINIYRPTNDTAGEGLAFIIAPNLNTPPNSHGQYLGLTNSTTDGNSSNKLVAIEVDTFKQTFDPDANHIGLDINSVRSVETVSLTPFGFEIAPKGAKFFNFWINYDGGKKIIDVYVAEQADKTGLTPPRPNSPILSHELDLRQNVNETSYFGFSASTGNFIQLNCVLRWNMTVQYIADDKKPWVKIVIGVGVPLLVLLLIGAAWLGYYIHKRRLANQSNLDILGKLQSLPGTPHEFKFRDLKKATNNFDEKNKLGQGGYGVVYRGKLSKDDSEIAVKWFSRESIQGRVDFLAELTIINRLRHRHLVKLLGWCHKNMKLLLVYEYMPNGSLDNHLFKDNVTLHWNLRHKIISGVASALHYLHNEYDQRVVHRDLKASNIMLDANFNARLGDFGLARALDNEKTSYAEAEGVLGTVGYIAPESFHTSKATQKSDVYAFGAVILEIVCGLRPGTKIDGFQMLVDWVWYLHRDGRLLEAVDKRLGDEYDREEAMRDLLLGLACLHPIAHERPKTRDIVQIIAGTIQVPDVPPFKPSFIWPAMPDMDLFSGSFNVDSTAETSLTTSNYNSEWSENYTGKTDRSMV